MDCSQPGSSVHGILQARILEWASISFSRGSSRPRNRTQLSHILGRCFNLWATREALELSIVVHFSYQHQNCFLKYIKPEHKNWGSTRCSVTTQRRMIFFPPSWQHFAHPRGQKDSNRVLGFPAAPARTGLNILSETLSQSTSPLQSPDSHLCRKHCS